MEGTGRARRVGPLSGRREQKLTDREPHTEFELFISFCSADREWVEGFLLPPLEAGGISYITEESFALGRPRITEFEAAVLTSRRTILVISKAYLADGVGSFVNLLAQSHGVESQTWPVIPIVVESGVQLPPRLLFLAGLDASTSANRENSLTRLFKELQRPVPEPSALPSCPYPGMAAFTSDDNRLFFGRDREIAALTSMLATHPFVAVIGPSGSGKSSLVAAGLIRDLPRSTRFGDGEWAFCTLRPGDRPLEEFERALGGPHGYPESTVDQFLRQRQARRLLLYVDQFEELFSLAERRDATETEAFAEALSSVSQAAGCYVVLTMRADFYGDLMSSRLWPRIEGHRFEVLPLDEEGLRRAIVDPAELTGVYVQSELVDRLITDAANEPGMLPLVQETLVELWDRVERRYMPLSAYEALQQQEVLVLGSDQYVRRHDELSGLQVAMARHAAQTLAELPSQRHRAIAHRILIRLVQFGDGRGHVRRQQTVDELRSDGDDPNEFDATLDHLARGRLVTLSGSPANADQGSRVDLAHEALIEGWPEYRQMIEANRQAEEQRRRLLGKAREWHANKEQAGFLDDVGIAEARRFIDGPYSNELGGSDEEIQRFVVASEKRSRKERGRRRALIVGLLVAVFLIAGIAVVAWQLRVSANREATLAASRELGLQARQVADQQLDLSLLLSMRAIDRAPTIEARSAFFAAMAAKPGLHAFLQGDQGRVLSIAFSEEGSLLASGGTDDRVLVWDVADQRRIATFNDARSDVYGLAFGSTGQYLAFSDDSGRIVIRDLAAAQPHAVIAAHDVRTRALAVSSAQPAIVASGDMNGRIAVWDLDGKLIWDCSDCHRGEVRDIAFSPDGTVLAAASDDQTISLHNAASGDLVDVLGEPSGHDDLVRALAFSPDGQWLVSGSNDARVIVWDVPRGKPAAVAESISTKEADQGAFGHSERIFAVAFDSSGTRIASAGREGESLVWSFDPDSPDMGLQELATLSGNAGAVRTLAFSSNGALASGGNDGAVTLWQLGRTSTLTESLEGHSSGVGAVAFWPDDSLVATGGDDSRIFLWSRDDEIGELVSADAHSGEEIRAVAWSPSGETLLTGGDDGAIEIWYSTETGLVAAGTNHHHNLPVLTIATSPAGSLVASGGQDGTVALWRLADGELVDRVSVVPPNVSTQMACGDPAVCPDEWVGTLAFSPDASILVAGVRDGSVWSWEVTDNGLGGQQVTGPDPRPVGAPSFVDGGRLVAVASQGSVTLHTPRFEAGRVDLGLDETLVRFTPPGFAFNTYAFSPDGQILAMGTQDVGIVVFDVASGQVLSMVETPSAVRGLAFSGDGETLVTVGDHAEVFRWDIAILIEDRLPRSLMDSWVQEACRRAGRDLTPAEWAFHIGGPYQATCAIFADTDSGGQS